ncbi:MAG: metallophosphoesterase [Legionellaceae bacterium]|nr:metallophosphoesterase [Legionellaceae bacterium]
MNLLILSDLHLEFGALELSECAADVVVLAGDIHLKTRGVEWALNTFGDTPVVMVFGNHEFYGEKYPSLVDKAKTLAQGSNVHVLENDGVAVDGVRFLGCTLWTNFRLFGDPRLAGYFCQQEMKDFKKIRVAPRYSKLNPVDVVRIHEGSLSWLRGKLAEKFEGKTVVVTHHAPSGRSLWPAASGDLTNAAYASNLDDFIEKSAIDLWVHGHAHNSSDYKVGGTRVVCNPRGYSPDHLNCDFRPNFIVDTGDSMNSYL